MERLESELRHQLARFGPPATATDSTAELIAIVRAWPQVVGEENARRAWPARLSRDGVLLVHASDSVWAFQLGMLAGEIHERLVTELGVAAPTALRFVPGPIPAPPAEPTARRTSQPPVIAREDTERAAELTIAIEDDELRTIVARAAAASLAKGRSDRAF